MNDIVQQFLDYVNNNLVYVVTIDLVIVASLISFFVTIIRRSAKALRKFLFIILLGILYIAISLLGLPISKVIFDGVMDYWVLLVLLIFMPELRFFFENIEIRLSSSGKEATEGQFMRTIMSSVESLSKSRTGALITIERNQSLEDYIDKAIVLNAEISEELIESIFNTQAPTHDGAVIIKDGRIACCGAYFPSTSSDQVGKTMGSRHRAALGISEIFDCLTIVVSEETGRISVTVDGFIERNLNKEGLQTFLTKYLD